MHILAWISCIASVTSLAFCWVPRGVGLAISIISLIISMFVFYRYYLGEKKAELKKARPIAFATFVFAILAVIGAIMMEITLVGAIYVYSATLQV